MKKLKKFILFILFFLFGCNSSILDDPSISIRFQVHEDSYVKLSIINSYDTLIAILVDEEKSAGVYEVNFDANDLAEGVYFYTIELRGNDGSFSKSTKQILLIK